MKPVNAILARYQTQLQHRGLLVPMHVRHCYWCECPLNDPDILGSEETQDHLVPVARGGSNKASNLARSCRLCNNIRETMEQTAFRHISQKIIKPNRDNYHNLVNALDRVNHVLAARAHGILLQHFVLPAQVGLADLPQHFGEAEPMELVAHAVNPWFWIGQSASYRCDQRIGETERGVVTLGDVALVSRRKMRGYIAENGDFRLVSLAAFRRLVKDDRPDTQQFRDDARWLFRWNTITWGFDRVGILYCVDDSVTKNCPCMCWTFENNPGAAYNMLDWAEAREEIETAPDRRYPSKYVEAVVEVHAEGEAA